MLNLDPQGKTPSHLTAGTLTASALVSGLALAPTPASAQLPGLPLPPLLQATRTLGYPCNWIESIHYQRRNRGYPDVNANYQIAPMPVLPAAGGVIRLRGTYPRARYFTFSVYDGFRPGNLLDSIQDWQLRPRLNGLPVLPPAALPAPRPDHGGSNYSWEITLKYAPPPANPAAREPDTLYMGDDQTRYLGLTFPSVSGNKQLTLRTYLPDAGQNELGGAALPVITYTAADGSVIDARANPQQAQCDRLSTSQDLLVTGFSQIGIGNIGNLSWVPDTSNDTFHFYPNGGTHYMRGTASKMVADMAIARFKMPISPDSDPLNAQVRYTSLCQNEQISTAVVACLADRQFVAQADGYVLTVVSTNARRPVKASPAFGYNWLPWGSANDALIYLRQILPNPLFVGNYAFAKAQPTVPLGSTLGEWAPQLSYCDSQTFEANVDAGGAVLIAACQANYRAYKNGINLSN